MEEEDNVVSVSTGPLGHAVDVSLQVPTATSLKLSCVDGSIVVAKVEGEIEVNNLNDPVTLTNVSGVVVAHSVSGEVVTQMDKVTPDKPMSFSTLNGDIDVTLPPQTKANVKLESQNGNIYSDFEIGFDKAPRPPSVEDDELARPEHALGEAVAAARENGANPAHIAEIGADAEDHRRTRQGAAAAITRPPPTR